MEKSGDVVVMGVNSQIYKVVISSPGDLAEERQLVKECINDWNTKNSEHVGIVFLPKMWEHNSVPEAGAHPQTILNKQLITTSDVMIAMFWSRIGSPTPNYKSGTIEEIDQFIATGKPVALYFSRKKADLFSTDISQLKALLDYKERIKRTTLYHEFTDNNELRTKINDFLNYVVKKVMNEVPPLEQIDSTNDAKDASYPHEREQFISLLHNATMANADGYWLSIVADFGKGYGTFQSKEKRHVLTWAELLLTSTLNDCDPLKNVGKGFAQLYSPSAAPYSFIFNFDNDGLVQIKWRDNSNQISLKWIILRLAKALKLLIANSIIGDNQIPLQMGFCISNAPNAGINSDNFIECTSTRTDFYQIFSTWKSSFGEPIDIEKFIRSFTSNLLEEWGYLDFEESLAALSIKQFIDMSISEEEYEPIPDEEKLKDALLDKFSDVTLDAINDYIDDTSNIDISQRETDIHEVLAASVDVLNAVTAITSIEQDKDNLFTSTVIVSAVVEIKDFFGSQEISDIVTLDFELEVIGNISIDGNIEKVSALVIRQHV